MLAVDEINAAGGVNGRKIKVITEDDQSKAGRSGQRRHQADLAEQRHRHPRRSGLVGLARRGADLPVEQSADDHAVVDQSRSHEEGRLHLPHLLHRQLPGSVLARFLVNDLAHQDAPRCSPTSRATTRRASARPSSEVFTALGGKIVGTPELRERRQRFPLAAHRDQGDESRRDLRPGLLHRHRPDRHPGPRPRHHRSAGRRRRLGVAEADRDRRQGARRLLLLEPLPRRRSRAGRARLRAKYKERYGATPTRWPPRLRRDARPRRRHEARRPSSRAPRLRDAIAATTKFPGVTGTITIDAERNAIGKKLVIEEIRTASSR